MVTLLGAAAVAVLVAATASTKTATSTPPATTNSHDSVRKASAPISNRYEREARSWIGKHAGGADNVAANLSTVQLALTQLRRSPTQADINQLAAIAQTAYNGLSIGSRFDDSDNDELGRGERQVVLGASDLKHAMEAIVAYADDPTRGRLRRMAIQYGTAVTEWNSGVRTIWRIAQSPRPPTV